MSLIEVKNNLLKFCYEENLILSGFVRVTDDKNSYIAQVLHLEATRIGKVAIAKILFMYNNDEISSYNGSIPSLRAEVSAINSSILLNSLEKKYPLNLGVLAQQNQKLIVDMSILNDNPIICAEKFFATKVFLNNLAIQLQSNGKKVIVFDTVGVFNSNKLTLSKDFKLPLNTSAINYIYNEGFKDATPETKAFIQSIFNELSEYAKTVPFIPFNSFENVVNTEFSRTKLIQLILLKNRIKQIGDLNIYGETENDFALLTNKILQDNTIVINISNIAPSLQKECIKYVYSLINSTNQEFYSFLPLNNENSDKELLTEINTSANIHTSIICGYDYNYLNELKQVSKNMFMFTPLKQQRDFGGYNIFLQKLAEDECIAYGKMTKFVPLIIKLHPIKADEIIVSNTVAEKEPVAKVDNKMVENFVNSITPESVNLQTEIITEENSMMPSTNEEQTTTAELSEVNVSQEETFITDTKEEIIEEAKEPQTASEDELVQALEDNEEEETEEPQTASEDELAQALEDDEEEETKEPQTASEDELAQALEDNEEETEEPQTASEDELTQALEEIPEIDDEELSNDDLDMIENLSKPDEEVINPQQVPPQEPEINSVPDVQPIPAPQPQPAQVQTANPQMMENTTNPTVPVYPAEIPEEDKVNKAVFQQGDKVIHEEFGEGIVEKMIAYGDKELCSINFASVGRRLLNPEITEMRKI